MDKRDILREPIDIETFDSTPLLDGMRDTLSSAHDTARASDTFNVMLDDRPCTAILTLAGSTSAGRSVHRYADTARHRIVDAITAMGGR